MRTSTPWWAEQTSDSTRRSAKGAIEPSALRRSHSPPQRFTARTFLQSRSPSSPNEQSARNRKCPRRDGGTSDEPSPHTVDLKHRLLHQVLGPRRTSRLPEQVVIKAGRQQIVKLGECVRLAARIAVHRRVRCRVRRSVEPHVTSILP